MDTAGLRFYAHGERVRRVSDGRTGAVKDISGLEVNVFWDGTDFADPASREWVAVTALAPAGPQGPG